MVTNIFSTMSTFWKDLREFDKLDRSQQMDQLRLWSGEMNNRQIETFVVIPATDVTEDESDSAVIAIDVENNLIEPMDASSNVSKVQIIDLEVQLIQLWKDGPP